MITGDPFSVVVDAKQHREGISVFMAIDGKRVNIYFSSIYCILDSVLKKILKDK